MIKYFITDRAREALSLLVYINSSAVLFCINEKKNEKLFALLNLLTFSPLKNGFFPGHTLAFTTSNVSLTNDVVSFEQLGPVLFTFECIG